MTKNVARMLAKTLWVFALCLVGYRGDEHGNHTAATVRDSSPTIGNISQSFQWGKIDQNIPMLIGNGDIGGTFDPFGGTTFDELRYGSGARRDIRTLLLTQLIVPDYWVLEDQGAHYLDPRYYRPVSLRKYLA